MTQGLRKSGGRSKSAQVVNFNQIRERRLEEKRRNTERIFFKNLLSVYSVVASSSGFSSLRQVELIDVSEEGCSFQVLFNPEDPWPKSTDNVPLRFYFSQDTFLEILVHIRNSKEVSERNQHVVRFGCAVDTETQSYAAYQQFIRFLKLYSVHAHKDKGDVTAFYL